MKLKPSTQWSQAPHRLGSLQRPGTECPPYSGHSETARPRTFPLLHQKKRNIPSAPAVGSSDLRTRNLHMLWIWNWNSLSSLPLLLWSSSLKLSRTFSFWSSENALWSKTGPATGCCRKLVWRQVLILDTFACLTSIVPYVLSEVSFRIIQFDSKDAPQSRTVDSAVDRTIPVHIPGRPKYIKIFYTAPFVVIGMLNNCIEWFGVPMLRRKPAILSSHLTISKFAIDLITKTHWSEHVHTSCLSACASPQHLLNRQNASWHSNTTNSTLFKKCMCKSTFAMHMISIEKLSRNANRNSNRKPESPRTE